MTSPRQQMRQRARAGGWRGAKSARRRRVLRPDFAPPEDQRPEMERTDGTVRGIGGPVRETR